MQHKQAVQSGCRWPGIPVANVPHRAAPRQRVQTALPNTQPMTHRQSLPSPAVGHRAPPTSRAARHMVHLPDGGGGEGPAAAVTQAVLPGWPATVTVEVVRVVVTVAEMGIVADRRGTVISVRRFGRQILPNRRRGLNPSASFSPFSGSVGAPPIVMTARCTNPPAGHETGSASSSPELPSLPVRGVSSSDGQSRARSANRRRYRC
jgi:hypothetical protein